MIGYYVHHHGAGHTHRFLAVRRHLPGVVGLGSGPRPEQVPPDEWIALPHDATTENPVDPTAGGALHWAPIGEPGLRERTARIADWARAHDPEALVVDVSVEVALAARLLSVPTVVVAQHGDRSDAPHALAYRSASAVAALWGAGLAPDPPGAAGRLHHVGPISRFDGRARASPRPAGDRSSLFSQDPRTGGRAHEGGSPGAAPRRVLLMLGRGGHDLPARGVRDAIDATRGTWTWDVIGDPGAADPQGALGARLASEEEVWEALIAAEVVVAPASNNCVAEVAAAGRPLIAIPQSRPFDEQHAHARALVRLGLVEPTDTWPAGADWPTLLDRVAHRGAPDWSAYSDGLGAERLAAAVRSAIERSRPVVAA